MEMIKRQTSHFNKSSELIIKTLVVISGITIVLFWFTSIYSDSYINNSSVGSGFGVVINPDMEVVEVEPSGSAKEGGLKEGDKLEKIDGEPVTTPGQARKKMVDKALNEQEVTLTVLRNQNSLELKLKPAPVFI